MRGLTMVAVIAGCSSPAPRSVTSSPAGLVAPVAVVAPADAAVVTSAPADAAVVASVPTPPTPPTPPAPPAPLAIERQLAVIGRPGVPAASAPGTVKALAAASKGKDPRANLEAALAQSPDFDDARYARALLLAKAGDFAAARVDLELLLAADLQGFEARVAADPGFATLREAPEGELLRARTAELDTLWQAAIDRGAPMLLFDGTHGSQAILTARVFRVGVWVHAARRFFAIGPPMKNAVAGFVDLAHGQAITVALQVNDCRSDFCPRIDRIDAQIWSTTAPPSQLGTWKFSQQDNMTHRVTMQSVAGGPRVQVFDCTLGQGCLGPWERVERTGTRQDKIQKLLPDEITLDIDHRGTDLTLPLPGFSVVGPTLHPPNGAPVAIDKRHRFTTIHCLDADPQHALVASTIDTCDCDNGGSGHVFMYQVSRVDLAAGTSESVMHGQGQVAVVTGKDGGVFVQIAACPSSGSRRSPTLARRAERRCRPAS